MQLNHPLFPDEEPPQHSSLQERESQQSDPQALLWHPKAELGKISDSALFCPSSLKNPGLLPWKVLISQQSYSLRSVDFTSLPQWASGYQG